MLSRSIVLLLLLTVGALAQEDPNPEMTNLEQRIQALENSQSNLKQELSSKTQDTEWRLGRLEDGVEAEGIILFLSGIICALWAQYTRRSAWLWFFFGLLLAPIALVAMVWKNALELKSGRLRHWTKDL